MDDVGLFGRDDPAECVNGAQKRQGTHARPVTTDIDDTDTGSLDGQAMGLHRCGNRHIEPRVARRYPHADEVRNEEPVFRNKKKEARRRRSRIEHGLVTVASHDPLRQPCGMME